MENAYGIGVKNRYELFYDEDVDPLEIIRQKEEEKEKRKTDKAHCKDKSKISKSGKTISSSGSSKKAKESPAVNISKPTESTDVPGKSRTRPLSDRTSKTVRNFEETKEIEGRKNFRNREDHQAVSLDSRERDGDTRARGRPGFRGRGGRLRGRGSFLNNLDGRPRREFDRHSGSDKTGLRSMEKRDGAGANNWGDMKDDFSRQKDVESTYMEEEFETVGEKRAESHWADFVPENEMKGSVKESSVIEKSSETVAENMESKENEPVTEERPEGMREMTLDEWKREQEAKRAVPKYNLRKPGEGEDGNQWKKLYMLKKKSKDEDDEDEEEEEEDVDDDEYAHRGRHRQLVDIQINFNDSRRGRGRGRGVRGGGSSGGGGGGGGGSSSSSGGIGPRSGASTGKERDDRERRDTGTGSNVGRGFSRGSTKSKSGQQSAPRVDDWNDFPSLVTA